MFSAFWKTFCSKSTFKLIYTTQPMSLNNVQLNVTMLNLVSLTFRKNLGFNLSRSNDLIVLYSCIFFITKSVNYELGTKRAHQSIYISWNFSRSGVGFAFRPNLLITISTFCMNEILKNIKQKKTRKIITTTNK